MAVLNISFALLQATGKAVMSAFYVQNDNYTRFCESSLRVMTCTSLNPSVENLPTLRKKDLMVLNTSDGVLVKIVLRS